MSSADVLFFPWPIGAGHTGRCLVAGGCLREAGWRCSFASDPTGGRVAREGFPVAVDAPARRPRATMPANGYLAMDSLDAAYASAGYYHPGRIRAQVAEDRKVLRSVRPRLVITHMQPTAPIAAHLEGIPVVSIIEADFVAPAAANWMPWMPEGSLPAFPYPPSLPAFRRVLSEWGLPEPGDIGDLLAGDRALVASTPDLEPIPAFSEQGRLRYVGPLIWRPDDREVASRLADLPPSPRPRVYVTLGSGEVSSAEEVARAALGAAESAGWSLLLATGYAGHLEIASPPGSLVRPFGGLGAALEWADAVVCHGGHSTVLATLLSGKPVVVAPFLSENEANGRAMVEQTGAGFLLHRSEPHGSPRGLRLAPRYPGLTPEEPLLSPRRLAQAVAELLGESAYAEAAQSWSADLLPWAESAPHRFVASLEGLLA